MRYMLTDELWRAMRPLVEGAKRHKGGQPPVLPDRDFFEALLYLARAGAPWRDLPAEFGRWGAVYNRFRRWVGRGARAGPQPRRAEQQGGRGRRGRGHGAGGGRRARPGGRRALVRAGAGP